MATTTRRGRQYRLDLSVRMSRSLLHSEDLHVLPRLLEQHASPWRECLHVHRHGRRIELEQGFAESVISIATERGETFREMVKRYGPGPSARQTGSIELRGCDDSLIVVIGVDDWVFAPSAGRYLVGNSISFQFCRARCCGVASEALARTLATACCEEMSVLHASGQRLAERDAKNMDFSSGAMAIGVDISRYLPGLYWLNYFGAAHCDLIGRERLLTAPAFDVRPVGDGVLLQVDEAPESWDAESSNNQAVMRHIGEEFFFLREQMDRVTRAPDFGLEPLKRFARFT